MDNNELQKDDSRPAGFWDLIWDKPGAPLSQLGVLLRKCLAETRTDADAKAEAWDLIWNNSADKIASLLAKSLEVWQHAAEEQKNYAEYTQKLEKYCDELEGSHPEAAFAGGNAPAKEGAAEPDYKEIALRTTAEFENYRKRVARERVDWQRDVLARFLKDFLPAFDDLDRTVAEGEKNQSLESVCEGVKLCRSNLWKTMEHAGIKEIPAAKGQKFDVHMHEAVSMIPLPGAEANTIIDVVKPGYMINDFVVRAAQVVVAAEMPK